ncbi:MAG: hypothetical protein M3Y81_15765 [Chloroflexota bacterium]|nr:hypothetical protein [Chloroflexota bacterium]
MKTQNSFPVGYHQLHQDVSLNFQMNCFYTWVGDESMLDEMRAVAPRIHGYADYTREFLALAEKALTEGQRLKGAYYLRAAESFLFPDDPAKRPMRERFVQLLLEHYDVRERDHASIPYDTGALSAYHFLPAFSTGAGAKPLSGGQCGPLPACHDRLDRE